MENFRKILCISVGLLLSPCYGADEGSSSSGGAFLKLDNGETITLMDSDILGCMLEVMGMSTEKEENFFTSDPFKGKKILTSRFDERLENFEEAGKKRIEDFLNDLILGIPEEDLKRDYGFTALEAARAAISCKNKLETMCRQKSKEDVEEFEKIAKENPLDQSVIISPKRGYEAYYKNREGDVKKVADISKVLDFGQIHTGWKVTGKGVRVKIYEEGIDVSHPGLTDVLSQSAMVHIPYKSDMYVAHGTAVADIIHQVAPGVVIGSPIQDIGEDLQAYADKISKTNDDVAMINISRSLALHTKDPSSGEITEDFTKPIPDANIQAIDKLTRAGKLIVMSAGNEGAENVRSRYYQSLLELANSNPRFILVGALDYSEGKERLSSFAVPAYRFTDRYICAPGSQMKVAMTGGKYKVASGTSFAAPIVVGVLGLLMEAFPYWKDTPEKYIELIRGSARKFTLDGARIDNDYGSGILAPNSAIKRALDLKTKWVIKIWHTYNEYLQKVTTESFNRVLGQLKSVLSPEIPGLAVDEIAISLKKDFINQRKRVLSELGDVVAAIKLQLGMEDTSKPLPRTLEKEASKILEDRKDLLPWQQKYVLNELFKTGERS